MFLLMLGWLQRKCLKCGGAGESTCDSSWHSPAAQEFRLKHADELR